MLFALFSSAINAAFISVATYPGAIAFTEMPCPAHSFDRALVSCDTPPLDAAYAGTVKPPLPDSSVVSISSFSPPVRRLTHSRENPKIWDPNPGALIFVPIREK